MGRTAPFTAHRDGDEWFYVIKGEFVYEVGGKLYRVVEGGSLVAPQKIPHRYINGPLPGTLFVGLTPGGRLEEFFEEGARRRRNPSPTPPTREEMVALFAKYNVDYIGGRLTEDDFKEGHNIIKRPTGWFHSQSICDGCCYQAISLIDSWRTLSGR